MELRPGYRQTEVGVIPEEWLVASLIDCCDYADYRGKTPRKTESGTVLITARNVRQGYIDYEESQEYVATEQYDLIMRRGKPQVGDVIITTEAPLGNVAQIDRADVALAQRIIKYRPKRPDLSARYLKHYLLADGFQYILDRHASGSTARGIKGSVLHQLPVAMPPPAEQDAIAGALGDADALIDSLEQLVDKTRRIKYGAMQQLLTGKKRLPGFCDEWAETEIGTLCELEKGEISGGGNTNYLEIGDIDISSKTYNVSGKEKLSVPGSVKVPAGTLLISTVRPTRGAIAVTKEATYVSNAFCRLRIKNPFPFYLVCENRFLTYLGENARGGTYPTCKPDDILRYKCSAPTLSTEESAIAAVLSDMDTEVAALEVRLAKARQLKQGMAQQLLTGRIRLL